MTDKVTLDAANDDFIKTMKALTDFWWARGDKSKYQEKAFATIVTNGKYAKGMAAAYQGLSAEDKKIADQGIEDIWNDEAW